MYRKNIAAYHDLNSQFTEDDYYGTANPHWECNVANLTTGIWHGDKFGSIITSSFKGALIGAAIGGVIQGTSSALKGNRFSDGAKVEYKLQVEDSGLNHVMQNGTNNCTCATGEMASNAQGASYNQNDSRSWMGGDKNLDPLPDVDVISKLSEKTGLNVDGIQPGNNTYIDNAIKSGKSIVMTVPGDGVTAHSVAVKGMYLKQITRVNGFTNSSMVNKIFDPAIGNPYFVTPDWVNKNVITIFSIWK